MSFPAWTALPRGPVAVRCSVGYSLDQVAANDTASGSVTVRVLDAAVLAAPTGHGAARPAVHPARPGAQRRQHRGQLHGQTAHRDRLRRLLRRHRAGPAGRNRGRVRRLDPGPRRVCDALLGRARRRRRTGQRFRHRPHLHLGRGLGRNGTCPAAAVGPAAQGRRLARLRTPHRPALPLQGQQVRRLLRLPAGRFLRPGAGWPLGVENKGPYKGAAGCPDGNGVVYAVKGNNTTGF